MDELEILKRRLAREVEARKQAEKILEEKSLELYELSNRLSVINSNNEKIIEARTKEIEANEIKYRNLVENASDIIYKVSIDGKFSYVNQIATTFSGYSEEELLGMNFLNLVDEKYKSSVISFYQFQLTEKNPSSYLEFPMVLKSGEKRWIGQSSNIEDLNGVISFNVLARDISDRKRAEKALILSEDKYRSIIENMELGLLEVDREGVIIRAYPKFCALTGFEENEIKGKVAIDIFLNKKERKRMEKRNLERKKGESSVYETQILKKDGTKVWVLISGAPYYDEKNRVAGSVGIHLDISKQKRLEADLRKSKKIAEQSVKHKDLFLANISHEIRTPLNAIIGITELLLQRNLSEVETKYASIIQKSSNNLLQIINDILNLARIKSGKLNFHETPTNLHFFLSELYDTFLILAEKKGLDLTFELDIADDQWYAIDATRIGEVIVNLVGNAIKFTDEGTVTLHVKKQLSYEDTDYFSFEVSDTGIGIPSEDLSRIFETFEQAGNNSKGEHGGTGLGLSISKSIIEQLDGTLNVTSVFGQGTKFFFEVSFKRSQPAGIETPATVQQVDGLKGKHILVAEDVEVNQFVARTILQKWECEVTIANNGQEVLDFLKEHTVDLILMDVRMPVLDGLKTTEIIRRSDPNLPIIALTANAISKEIEHCIEVGMNDYLSKPYTQIQLLAKLNALLNINPVNQTTDLDLSRLNPITNGDEAFEKRMIELFVKESQLRIIALKSALKNNDPTTIQHIAHAMKPSVAHICSQPMLELVRSIENNQQSTTTFNNEVTEFITRLERLLSELA